MGLVPHAADHPFKPSKILLLAALLLIILIDGCQLPNSTAMGGTWLFTIRSNGSGIILVTANLTQNGSQITGQLTLSSTSDSCGTAADLTGSIQGNNLTLVIVQLQSKLLLVGTVNSAFTNASGTYNASGNGACFQDGDLGTWSAFFASGG